MDGTGTSSDSRGTPDSLEEGEEGDNEVKPHAQRVLTELMDMGFGHHAALHAVKAARGNRELAVEFLLNGIPEDVEARLNKSGGNKPRFGVS